VGFIGGAGYNFGFGAGALPSSAYGAYLSNNVAHHSVDLVLPVNPFAPIQITSGSDSVLLSQTTIQVNWQTDVPSDSRVNYGPVFDYSITAYDPTLTTNHSLTLSGLVLGDIYDYIVTSATANTNVTDSNFFSPPTQMAGFQFPDPQTLVSGTVWLKALHEEPSIVITQATFYYLDPVSGAPILIGTDTNGDDEVFNTFQPAPTGDGWSAYWNTTNLPDGSYQAVVQLATTLGVFDATNTLFLDQTPPIPTFVTPRFSEAVAGQVPLQAQKGYGTQAVFEVQQTLALISYSPVPLNQTNYPYDGHKGSLMCDPTAEAAVLLSDSNVVEVLRREFCTNVMPPDECIRQQLIKRIRKAKGTGVPNDGGDVNGTGWDKETAGTTGILNWLCALFKKQKNTNTWNWEALSDHTPGGYNVQSMKAFIKRNCEDKGKTSKGAIIHIQPCNGGTGHVMAVVSINDDPNEDGTLSVVVMDPATGSNITIKVDKKGNLRYPPNAPDPNYCLIGCEVICAPGSGTLFARQRNGPSIGSWLLIGVDNDGSQGWHSIWDTANCAPGFYWLRVTVTDALGHSGQDMIEVILAPVLGISLAQSNAVLSWPVLASNFVLQSAVSLSPPVNWSLVTDAVGTLNGQLRVSEPVGPSNRFYRLLLP
jgi:hypothetical protein